MSHLIWIYTVCKFSCFNFCCLFEYKVCAIGLPLASETRVTSLADNAEIRAVPLVIRFGFPSF